MGQRMCFGLFIVSLLVECNGQGLFNISATVNGNDITINIMYDSMTFTTAVFQCQLDDGDFEPCSDGFVYTSVPDGTHSVSVMGDLDGSSGTAELPSLNVSLPLRLAIDVEQNGTALALTITANQEATFECQVDDREFTPCASPFVLDISSLSAGIHNITIRAIIDGTIQGIATQPFEVIESVIVEFKDLSYSVLESDRIFNVILVKRGNLSRPIRVSITASDITANNVDRAEESREVIFNPGDSDQLSVEFTVNNDNFLEKNETFFLNLSLPETSGAQIGAKSSAVVTIINDDRLQLLFFQESINVEESDRLVTYLFSFGPATKETQEEFLVLVETFDLVPTDAQAGMDYQPNIESFTLSRLSQIGTASVTIIDDKITEQTESFGARIIIPEETRQLGIDLGTPSTIIFTISDNDEGDLDITCYTIYYSSNRSVQLFFEGNQEADFLCAINNNVLQTCTSPTTFQNVGYSDSVTVTVRGETTLRSEPQNKTLTKNVLLVEGDLQVTGIDEISVSIRSTKDATFMCKLNNRESVECVNGQVFSNLDAGTYTMVIEATGVNNTREVATDTVGPVVISGVGASARQAIATCFGRKRLACDTNGSNCEYTAMWRTRGNRVIFTLQAALQGWVAIGFSRNNIMPETDIIVGAANAVDSFVDDRYAVVRTQPTQDTIQNIDGASVSFVDGDTVVQFSRDKVTNDVDQDINIDVCRFVLFAWGDDVNVSTQEIRYHGSDRRNVSETLICFPSNILCPEQFVCADPGTPVNGGSSFTDGTLEGSVVTYTCEPGFTLVGTTMQTCVLEADGPVWRNGSLPTCTMNICSDPGQPDNGNTIGDDFSIGATVNHTCNVGYVLDGASERECLPSGNWSEPLPVCNEVNCDDPGTPVNGDTTGVLAPAGLSGDLDTTLGAVVNHTCNEGFVLQGEMERECLITGEWSDPLPTCVTDCGDPGIPENGSTLVTVTTAGAVVNHTCNDGFVLRGAIQRECLPSGEWSDPLPSCTVDCGDPGTPNNGNTIGTLFRISLSDNLTLDTTLGAIVNHTCNAGFVLQGAMEQECLPSGEWSAPLPLCIVDCGDPGIPENGDTLGSVTTIGAVANHICNDRFVISGAIQRECLPSGEWSEPLPSCVVDCGDPGIPQNGSTEVTVTTVGAGVNHTCNEGLVLRGAMQRECMPNGEWSEQLPSCVVDCGNPGIPNNGDTMGMLVDQPDPMTLNTTLGAVVNHSCIVGYTLQGAVERECLPSGNWSAPLPTCIMIVCEDLGEPDNGATSGTAVTVGSIVNHTCNVGFILNGASQRECLPNRMWSSPLPICTRNITRFGGPVFKVPIHIDQALIDENPDLAEAYLCYEVQGVDNKTFNLLSDTCVSVNALYQAMANPTDGNVISRIGITAIDQDGTCRRIEASLDSCSASVDGTPVETGTPFSNSGISVIRYRNRVRISVPNCRTGSHKLVLWFICKTLKDGQPVSEFVIADGVNLRPTSHGLTGQFWNIPVGVDDYTIGDPPVPNYVVDVNPFNAASRTFIGLLNDLPKHVSLLACLQVGNSQGGATDDFTNPNDSVIEGSYVDYEVTDLFSTDFMFSRFRSVCT